MDMALALANADVLAEIQRQQPAPSLTAIAKATGRDASNLLKTLKRLEAEGLLVREPSLDITPAAGPVIQGHQVAAGKMDVPYGFLSLYHAQIIRSALNPRKEWDADDAVEDMVSLMSSILENGLLQNLVVRPLPPSDYLKVVIDGVEAPMYELVAGERRWRAIHNLIHDGDWPEDRRITCKLVDVDHDQHQVLALEENLRRRDLNPIEEARAFDVLIRRGMAVQELADRLSVSVRQVQLRLQLLNLSGADQERMMLPKDDPNYLGPRAARDKLQVHKPKPEARPPNPDPEPAKALTLSPKLALVVAELADKIEKHPATYLPGGYTRINWPRPGGPLSELVRRGIVGLRDTPLNGAHATIFMHRSAALDWLKGEHFYDGDRQQLLLRLRLEVVSAIKAKTAAEDGHYVTDWLNVAEPTTPARAADPHETGDDEDDGEPAAPVIPGMVGDAFSRQLHEAADEGQPELIPSTPQERAAIAAARAEAEAAEVDNRAVDQFAALMKEKLCLARAKGLGGWNGEEKGLTERLAALLVEQVEKGDPVDIANLAMFVRLRAGAIAGGWAIAKAAQHGRTRIQLEARG